jgi:hypothetical protein
MMKSIKFKDVLVATVISILLFSLSLVLCYVFTIKRHTDFDMGFPWVFYYQFAKDGDIQHGSDLKLLIGDCLLFWAVSVVLYVSIKVKSRPIGK